MKQLEVKHDVREKLAELRRVARRLQPEVRGTVAERKAAATKGYRDWEPAKKRANEAGNL